VAQIWDNLRCWCIFYLRCCTDHQVPSMLHKCRRPPNCSSNKLVLLALAPELVELEAMAELAVLAATAAQEEPLTTQSPSKK